MKNFKTFQHKDIKVTFINPGSCDLDISTDNYHISIADAYYKIVNNMLEINFNYTDTYSFYCTAEGNIKINLVDIYSEEEIDKLQIFLKTHKTNLY